MKKQENPESVVPEARGSDAIEEVKVSKGVKCYRWVKKEEN